MAGMVDQLCATAVRAQIAAPNANTDWSGEALIVKVRTIDSSV